MRHIKGLFFLYACVLFCSLYCPALGEGRSFVPTEEWEPPVIDVDKALHEEPWLLVLKIAQEELGYTEGPKEDQTKYGLWFDGDEKQAWCAEFLTWCVNQADERYGTNLMGTTYPFYGHPRDGAPWFLIRERFITSREIVYKTKNKMWMIGSTEYLKNKEYIPHAGDYMWFSYVSPKKGTDHVAIVEGVSVNEDGSYLIHVIEGNNPDSVQRNTYDQSWKLIYGYGTPVRRANRVIRLYNHSDDCLAVSEYLFKKGYLKEKDISNEYSKNIVKAVKQYQKDNGLKTSGEFDMEARGAFEKDPEFLNILKKTQR